MSRNTTALLLAAGDNVAVLTDPEDAGAGDLVRFGDQEVTASGTIPRGHKVAVRPIPSGGAVLKYGYPIGVATQDIARGEHVHVHNVGMTRVPPPEITGAEGSATGSGPGATFSGYRRRAGRAGVRNYVVVAASVNCSATVVKAICRHFLARGPLGKGLHGVVPLTHAAGCAQAIGGEGYQVLNRTLAGSIFHPNVVGAVIVGLGCEGTTFRSILDAAGERTAGIPIEHVGIQDSGGTAAAIRSAIERVEALIASLPDFERTPVPLSDLRLALNCGGSDGFSGLTANPVLGLVSDRLASLGAGSALAEIPECHGAEQLLYGRCASPAVAKKLDQTFAWWHAYAERHGVSLNENLAPGNLAGGITTILEKSLGAVSKGGSSPLTDVVGYSAPIETSGLVLMNTPGFDPVSVTGLVAGGCQLVAFTTGRGSVYGSAIAPTLKIATTSSLFRRMPGDMDFDAGRALSTPAAAVAAELFELVVSVAEGQTTRSEELGLGWEEFVPWAVGETL